MKKLIVFILGTVFLMTLSYAAAQDVPASTTATPAPAPAMTQVPAATSTPVYFSPEHLKGYLGVGVGTTPLGGTALALRYWMDEKTALDVMVSGGVSPITGVDFSGNNFTITNWSFGLSLGLKENWKEPVPDVFVQWIERLTYSQSFAQNTGTTSQGGYTYGFSNNTNQNQAVNLFLGLGFEAFLPVWRNISIEGNAGLSVNATFNETSTYYNHLYTSTPDVQTTNGFTNLGVNSNSFSIFSGAVHFYF